MVVDCIGVVCLLLFFMLFSWGGESCGVRLRGLFVFFVFFVFC